MLCISEDDYSDSEHVHIGKYAAPRPHIQADLYRLGREIQRILMEEPGYALNLCKLREKYEFFYGKPLDKLGYSKLVDCAHALPEPITTRNARPNGVVLLLMRHMRDSCKAFQRGQCPKQPDECDGEHECDLCGYPMHGASQCVDEGAPDTKPVQSYTHCCLRSKCVGDIHNPDVVVPDADELILAGLSINTKRISVDEMLKMQGKYQAPPAFINPGLECINGRLSVRSSPRRPRAAPPLDEKQLKIRAFYAHFVAWLKNRYREFKDWPRDRQDFSFDWESYLSGNREMRQTVVALIDFAPSATLVYLSAEAHIVSIVNLTELVWNPSAIAELLEITGASPPASRRWSQSSNQWGEGSANFGSRNPAPRTWADQIAPVSATPEMPSVQQPPAMEQKVVFTILKSNDIQDPPVSSTVWRPESPERYTSKIPVPTSSRYVDEDVDDNRQSRAWSSSWRPKASDYPCNGESDSKSIFVHVNANSKSAFSNAEYATTNEGDEEEGAINEDEVFAAASDVDVKSAVAHALYAATNEDDDRGAVNEDEQFAADKDVDVAVNSSYKIQHEYYGQLVESTQCPMLHDSVSHMENIANAYASNSSSEAEVFDDAEVFYDDNLCPTLAPTPVRSSPAKEATQDPPSWTDQRVQLNVVNSSFSALFGDSAPSQQLLPERPFVAEFDSEQPESFLNIEDSSLLSSVYASQELSPSAPEFIQPSASTPSQPKLSPFASEFVKLDLTSDTGVDNAAVEDAEPEAEEELPPKITIDNKIVVGDGIGQNYRRMNDIVSRSSDFAFRSDVSSSEVVADLQRLGLAQGVAPNMTWNADRVLEIESLLFPRSSSFDPASHQIVSDQNEEFLKNLLYQAILGTKPASNEEIDLFIHECLRLQHAGVDSVLAGMRSLWVASRACSSSGASLFQTPSSRPVISNGIHSSKPSALVSSKGSSRLAPSSMRKFLQEADLEEWQNVFDDQEIGFELLPELTDADLVDLGMTNIRERQRFHDTVRIMKY